MMDRFVRIAVLAAATLACIAPAQAGWHWFSRAVDGTKEFGRQVARDTKRRNCWPQPFVGPDRHAVRSPFAIMVSNGWRAQNLLGDHHFTDKAGELNEAGRMKVRWILTEAPQHHRTIYVHKTLDPELTAGRIDNVQQYATKLIPDGPLPMVMETSVPVRGWPASQADMIGRKFEASTPDPRLPEASGGGESQ